MLRIDPDEVLAFNPDLDRRVVDILIRDGLAMARMVAPCIDDDEFVYGDAATAIIRSAVLRWAESGSGAVTTEQDTAGAFSHQVVYDTRSARRSLFFPSEIKKLEALCSTATGVGAVDTIPAAVTGCVAGGPGGCVYVCGSVSSPCPRCGQTLRPGLDGVA